MELIQVFAFLPSLSVSFCRSNEGHHGREWMYHVLSSAFSLTLEIWKCTKHAWNMEPKAYFLPPAPNLSLAHSWHTWSANWPCNVELWQCTSTCKICNINLIGVCLCLVFVCACVCARALDLIVSWLGLFEFAWSCTDRIILSFLLNVFYQPLQKVLSASGWCELIWQHACVSKCNKCVAALCGPWNILWSPRLMLVYTQYSYCVYTYYNIYASTCKDFLRFMVETPAEWH